MVALAALAATMAQADLATVRVIDSSIFWMSHWEANDAKSGVRAGSSRIEQLHSGCALRENWS